jgi:predicted CoA-binding protein
MDKKTVVIGASTNESRYSNLAVKRLQHYDQSVVPIGLKSGLINGIEILTGTPAIADVDTVTLYLNAENQKSYYDYILSLHPKRIIFNPGTENSELEALAQQKNIETIEACTLVMLNTGQY